MTYNTESPEVTRAKVAFAAWWGKHRSDNLGPIARAAFVAGWLAGITERKDAVKDVGIAPVQRPKPQQEHCR